MEKVLTDIIFLPFVTALLLGVLRAPYAWLRLGALFSSFGVLVLVLAVAAGFDPDGGLQYVRHLPWIANYGIAYFVGVDALSLVLLLLIAILIPLLYLYMWHEKRKGYWYNMMLLQTGVTGAVLSLDLILFYLFWETMLLPVFIMIGRYGSGDRQRNAMKIVLMTMMGSMSMLLAILYLGYSYFAATGGWSFALENLSTLRFASLTSVWLAAGFLLAFAIKIPLVGFHTWMAPAYGSSPTPAVVILSAIMAKLGAYGIWRFGYGLFEPTLKLYAPFIMALAIIGMLYFAVRAVTENDLRRMFAYASGSHLSLIALGVFVTNLYGWGGSLYFIATHALSSAGIFIMIGLLYKRVGSISIDALGGLAQQAPKFALFFVFFALSIAGLPGTGGFVGELLIIVGAFKADPLIGMFAATTMLAAMLYVFWMLQRTVFGSAGACSSGCRDLDARELAMLIPLALLLLVTGIAPSLFTPIFEPQLTDMLAALGGAR
ncbi:complex I subunit 4 family protein [Thiomicrolovo sp. ZZH C-3]